MTVRLRARASPRTSARRRAAVSRNEVPSGHDGKRNRNRAGILVIRRPVATSLMAGALAFLGLAAFPFLPVAPLPQVDFPTVLVTATLAGASAETMASSVATPLERQIGQIAGITQMTSLYHRGRSRDRHRRTRTPVDG